MPIFADLAFINGTVITMDRARPRAAAVACAGGRIVAVGSQHDVDDWIGGKTEVVDLRGQALIPGMIDAHNHMLTFGRLLSKVSLRQARSMQDIVRVLQERARETPAGQWVEGERYDHTKLAEGHHPTRQDLDAVAPHHPVLITHTSGHIIAVNSAALAAAGVTRDTPDPPGGHVDRDPRGEPTGVLKETAGRLVRRIMPRPTRDRLVECLHLANERYLSEGLTTQCDMGCGDLTPGEEWGAWQQAWEDGALTVRSRLYVRYHRDLDDAGGAPPILATGIRSGFGDARLRISGLKYLIDGGIGPATAALFEPYIDDPDNRGILILDPPEVDRLMDEAHRLGYQIAIHAIGDRAVAVAAEAIARAAQRTPRVDHRHRIEHCAMTPPQTIGRLRDAGIIPSPQPHFLSQLGDSWVRRLDAERLRWAFPLKTWMEAGFVVAGGSDRPVVGDGSPLRGVVDAVMRTTDGGHVLAPEERLPAEEALRMFTWDAAYAIREERVLGSLEVGKRADLAVLSDDPTRVEPVALAGLRVDMTVVGGQILYSRR